MHTALRRPSLSLVERRPARAVSAHLRLTLALVVGASLAGTGCGRTPFSGESLQQAPVAAPLRPAPAAHSPGQSSSPLQRALGHWLQAVTQPPSPRPAAAPAALHAVSIDVLQLARRHPAWRLADALEHESTTNVQVTPPRLIRERFGAPVPLGPLQVAAPGGAAGFYRDEQRVEVNSLVRLQVQARIKQDRAINDFVAEVATRQEAARAQRATNLRAALAEDVAAARQVALADLQPELPPDPIQLEMTNLRLDLLRNVQRTPQAREQALRRLRELQAQWEAKLGSQAAARLEELRVAREQRPAEMQRAGEAQIETTMKTVVQRDAAVREDVLQEHRARVEQDLTADEARLGIDLPAASLPPQSGPATPGSPPAAAVRQSAVTVSTEPNKDKTTGVRASSTGYDEARMAAQASSSPVAHESGAAAHAPQIRALRAQAWSDARRWALLTAQRQGWTWVESASGVKPGVPDRTAAVLKILFLS